MSRESAIIIGDTRNFHIGSYVNCFYLAKMIGGQYDLLGLFGAEDFHFFNYADFLKKIKKFVPLCTSLEKSDVIFCNGEGVIEPNSIYGDALFYLATYVRQKWPIKKICLINFSCFDELYGDWSSFDVLMPRDKGSFDCLNLIHQNVRLGFDCSVLQDINNVVHKGQNLILVFRGRRDVVRYELEQIKRSFSTKKIILASSFWKFDHDKPINTGSLSTLQELLQQALLVVSSSFHGIIFSIRFGIPFIPIETMATRKNLSVSYDVLGTHYKQMDFSAWLEFYKDKGNYNDIERHLIKVLPQLQKRALVYSQ